MLYLRYSKSVFGMRVGSVALAAWMVLGLFGTASALAGKPEPPPAPADPAIAFERSALVKGQRVHYLSVCNADGTNAADLITLNGSLGTGTANSFSWAPDGRSIAFAILGGAGTMEIWRIDVSVANGVPVGSNLMQLVATTSTDPRGLDWSPLGDQIVYAIRNNLYTVPAGGGTPQLVYSRPVGASYYPRWSADGTRVAFLGPDLARGFMDLQVLDLGTGTVTTVAWLGNGVLAAGLDGGNASNLFSFVDWGVTAANIMLVNGDAGEITRLNATAGAWCASFSPDDSQLVYSSGGHLMIYTVSNGAVITLPVSGMCLAPEWRRNP
jgi:Tol biopolymer transport system component